MPKRKRIRRAHLVTQDGITIRIYRKRSEALQFVIDMLNAALERGSSKVNYEVVSMELS